MANRLKQPCFVAAEAEPEDCVPDPDFSRCCACEEEQCGDICTEMDLDYQFTGADPCASGEDECQGGGIEFKWGTPPGSLTSLLGVGQVLYYQFWRTRKVKNDDETVIPVECQVECPVQPDANTLAVALLNECEPDFMFSNLAAAAGEYAFASEAAGMQIPGPVMIADGYFAGDDPSECTGVMPNFVVIATANSMGTELARCYICPGVTPGEGAAGGTAGRKPQICPGAVCCPNDAEAYHGQVCVTIGPDSFTLTEIGLNLYSGGGAATGPAVGDATVTIGCAVVEVTPDAYDLRWTITIQIETEEDVFCFGNFVGLGLFGGYDCDGTCGDCGYDEDTEPNAVEGAC